MLSLQVNQVAAKASYPPFDRRHSEQRKLSSTVQFWVIIGKTEDMLIDPTVRSLATVACIYRLAYLSSAHLAGIPNFNTRWGGKRCEMTGGGRQREGRHVVVVKHRRQGLFASAKSEHCYGYYDGTFDSPDWTNGTQPVKD
jgi:hypothetical protein